MPRGGYRPGAGRPKGTSNRRDVQAVETPNGPSIVVEFPNWDPKDPSHVIELFQRGASHDPDGQPLTPARFAAAKELMQFRHGKISNKTERNGPDRPVAEVTDDELRAIIAREIEARTRGDGAAGAP